MTTPCAFHRRSGDDCEHFSILDTQYDQALTNDAFKTVRTLTEQAYVGRDEESPSSVCEPVREKAGAFIHPIWDFIIHPPSRHKDLAR